jgi:AraC-like DNA-binding protein
MRQFLLTALHDKNNNQPTLSFEIAQLEQRIEQLISARVDQLLNKPKKEDIDCNAQWFKPLGLSAKDGRLLQNLDTLMENNYHDPQFSVNTLSSSVAMVERQLRRKLKSLINHGPGEYIRMFRLEKAIEKMNSGEPLHLAAENAGFTVYSTFSTNFRARYNMSPSKYLAMRENALLPDNIGLSLLSVYNTLHNH